ncbi:outer membrane receptor protein involved in Fe transport [Sporomusaceae bacterium BoRhaA]|uniref:TonB-dependent receptor n=1 Tax=Pelorhabdus rhamnosifermentans TaxID=2772457 RepID=UPI001C062F7B|nr:TonB-dependent receptor [Pelorhabdus rhamnosifermentans]MBU2700963.1 outer membrane receptor protein involved in Fe transport [Pelorhabdus rhamnosifermentans]
MKQARRKKLAAVIGCMLLYASWAPAVVAADAADDEVVEEVDVTDTRLKERLAIKKTEITSADIKAQGAETATQVLEKQAGIVVSGNNIQGKATVSIHGSDATNTKVFVDGVPLSSMDGIVDLNSIAADSIEKIEVYKGAAPVQYGSDAGGGVIYITTKKGGKQSADFSTSVGSWNTLRQSASLSGGNQKVNYYFDVKHETSDGYTANTAKRDNYYDGKLDFALNATSSLTLSGSYARKYEELPDRYDQNGVIITNPGSGGQIGNAQNTSSFWYNTARLRLDPASEWHSGLAYNQKLSDNSDLKLTVYKSGENTSLVATRSPTYTKIWYGGQNSTASASGYQLEHTIKTSSVNTVLWGSNWETRRFDQDTNWGSYDVSNGFFAPGPNYVVPVQYHYDSHSYFFQDTLKLGKLVAAAGYRQNFIKDHLNVNPNAAAQDKRPTAPGYDPDDSSSSHIFRDPMAGFSYAVNDRTSLHASIGKSFRYPLPVEIASFSTIGSVKKRVGPEQALNRELGVTYTAPDGLSLDVTGFYKTVTDKIRSRPVDGATVYDNAGQTVTMKGFETEVSKTLNDRLKAVAQYTYTLAQDPEEGHQFNDQPKNKGSLGLNYTGGRGLKAYLSLNYVGSRFSDFSNGSAGASTDPSSPPQFQSVTLAPYTSVDLMMTKELKNREYYVKFNNMLDKQYYSSAYLIAPGRYVEYGVKIKFQ